MANLQQMVQQPTPLGEGFIAAADITGPNPYVNPGGQSITAQAFGLQTFRWVLGSMVAVAGGNYAIATTPAGPGSKTVVLRWYVATTGAEVANGVDLSGSIVRIVAWGN